MGKTNNSEFDVGIGSRDGAECCEIVDLFMLTQITEVEKMLPKKDFGTFRDDFLGCTTGNPMENERKKKKLIEIFRKYGLKIEIGMNATRANYLDVTMDIIEGSFEPF